MSLCPGSASAHVPALGARSVRRKYAAWSMAGLAQGPLEETVHALAAIDRGSATEGEREAAEWLAARLRRAGLEPEIDEEPALGRGFWWPLGVLSAVGAAAGVAALRGQ